MADISNLVLPLKENIAAFENLSPNGPRSGSFQSLSEKFIEPKMKLPLQLTDGFIS